MLNSINTRVPGFYWTMAPRPTQIHSFSMYLSRLSISRVYSLHTPSMAFPGRPGGGCYSPNCVGVFLHTFPQSHPMWQNMQSKVAVNWAFFPVLLPDLPIHSEFPLSVSVIALKPSKFHPMWASWTFENQFN